MNTQVALDSYAKVHYSANVEIASPHRLIDMLYEGALERITQAKGAMEFGNPEIKGKKINDAVRIVGGLRENLNTDKGGEIAGNLDALYVYIQTILTKAHAKNDIGLLDESVALLIELRLAWKQIG
ncbi:MAG: flagellar export chaperone FliS [Alteromonadaceae bacterium]|nr:MAG: flagellar export chaperone FliS [Alteromonadaceae bacterium]